MSMTLLKKLGAKQILGDIKNVVKEKCVNDGDACEVYSIYGTSNGMKTGVGTFGDWCAFVGNMEAINHVTGEAFAAVSCFVPEPLSTILKNGLAENESIEFAFTVSVKRRDDTKEGYEYFVKPHTKMAESDPLANLRALVAPIAQPQIESKSKK